MSALIFDILLLVGGIGVLYFGAEWLVRGSARLAASLGVSPIVVGLTVVSFGTSAPELVVATMAALGGKPDLAVGNVMGSNLANIGLILGLTAVVRPLDVATRVVRREVPIMLLVTALIYPLAWDGGLSRVDGFIFLGVLVAYLLFVFRTVDEEVPEILDEYQEFMEAADKLERNVDWRDLGLVLAGSGGLVLGGRAIVEGALAVASSLNISEVVIGLTVVAVGTSLPELATALVAAMRREADLAVGNVIGSNIFNVAAILGTASVLAPLDFSPTVLTRELPAVLILSVLVFPLLRTEWRIQRWEGALLLGSYLGIGFWLL